MNYSSLNIKETVNSTNTLLDGRYRSLWVIVVTILVLTLITSTVASGILAQYWVGNELIQELETDSERALTIFSAAAQQAVISENISVLDSMVSALVKSEPSIVSISITNKQDIILVQWDSIEKTFSNIHSFNWMITISEVHYGSIDISWDSSELTNRIDHYVLHIQILITSVLIIFSIIIMVYLYFSTIKPVVTISNSLSTSNDLIDADKLCIYKHSQELYKLSLSVKDLAEMHKVLSNTHTQLLQSEKLSSIGQLATGIAHEINTPIQFIGDNTYFLQDSFKDINTLLESYKKLSKAANDGSITSELAQEAMSVAEDIDLEYLIEEIPTAIKQSLDGVDRVSNIVLSMKEFSHPGSKEKHTVDLNHSIQSTITISRNAWKYDAELITDFDQQLPVVLCYAGEINQVILNIIVNAAHAINDSNINKKEKLGLIKISTKSIDDYVEICISDNGTGIPKNIINDIFNPFFTTKDVGKGTGQGLSIAHRVIVETHHGSLNVESEVGIGTVFTICLPISGQEPNSADPLQAGSA